MSYFECFSVTIILRCNLTKSDESTFFILNVDLVFVRNFLLSITLIRVTTAKVAKDKEQADISPPKCMSTYFVTDL